MGADADHGPHTPPRSRRLASSRRRALRLAPPGRASRADAGVAFRTARDRLFAEHPSSPIPADERRRLPRASPTSATTPRSRCARTSSPIPHAPDLDVPRSDDGPQLPLARIGWVRFMVDGSPCRLSVFWLNEYAGGIFIPFRDATSGTETYGGGRYLWDSAKGADLGADGDELVLDFNYAYHPSCAYDPLLVVPARPAGELAAGRRSRPASGSRHPRPTMSDAARELRRCIKCGREVGPDESICEVCNRAGMATPSATAVPRHHRGRHRARGRRRSRSPPASRSAASARTRPSCAAWRRQSPRLRHHLRGDERGHAAGRAKCQAHRARRAMASDCGRAHDHRPDRGRCDAASVVETIPGSRPSRAQLTISCS